jgi:hypothetical protein
MIGNGGTAAYGIYPHDVALPDVVYTLNRGGFSKEDICMVLSPAHPVAAIVRDANLLNAEREASAMSARTIGWFSEFGAVVIPTIGFFIRSQAYFHSLVVERNSQGLCGGSGTLVGLGFSEDQADRLNRRLGVLVYVSCNESARAERAVELLRRNGAGEAAALGTTPLVPLLLQRGEAIGAVA